MTFKRSCAHAAILWVLAAAVPLEAASNGSPFIRLRSHGELHNSPSRTFVVTHGYNGTREEDRFQQLAWTLKRSFPDANVYLVDWSKLARDKGMFGLPNPWAVARRIDAVGRQAAMLLEEAGVDPARTTLIGESFGAYVNHRLAESLGGVDVEIALNPASPSGGYSPPDLRTWACSSLAFVTASPFDCQEKIADRTLQLTTPEGATPFDQHTYGVIWLRQRLEEGDRTWVQAERVIPRGDSDRFDAVASLDGGCQAEQPLLPSPARAEPIVEPARGA
jgi:pimeloyl-ACP methyl ester carboxylesterase